jgi:hypothetical protein
VEIGKVRTDFHFPYNPHESNVRLFGLDRAGFNRHSMKSVKGKVRTMNSIVSGDALFYLFPFQMIELLGFDYCYNWKQSEG